MKLLTSKQVAEFLQVNRQTIYRLVAKDAIPYLRVGGVLRFHPEMLERWLKPKRISVDPRLKAVVLIE